MKTKFTLTILTLAAAWLPRIALADDRGFNTSGTLDCVMVEDRRPYGWGGVWAPFDSQCPVVSTEGASFGYYTGLGNGGSYWHWSTWPIGNPINSGDVIKISYLGPQTWGHGGNGAEGTSAGMDGIPSFVTTNVWYRFVLKSWLPADGTPHQGYIGEWARDGATGNWYHFGTYQTPFTVKGVTGVDGFMEVFATDTQAFRIDHRNCFAHQYGTPVGTWQRANTCYVSGNSGPDSTFGYYASLIESNTATMIEHFGTNCAADPLGTNRTSLVFNANGTTVPVTMTNQPATPPFDPIVVTNSTATLSGSQLLVQWQSPATSSPQLSYKIEVFTNAGYTGTPVATWFDRDTEAQQKILNLVGVNTPYVRLTLTDIFDNTNTPILITAMTAVLNPATNVVGAVNGLAYQYYQTNGSGVWTSLPNFAALTPVSRGAAAYPDMSLRQQRSEYAFNFSGFFMAPSNGVYTFTLTSYDSSKLVLDGQTVIDFNGVHQPGLKSGSIALQAGLHPVNLQYAFSDQRGQCTWWDGAWLACEGPGVSNAAPSPDMFCPGLTIANNTNSVPVPLNLWYRVPGTNEPVIVLNAPANNTSLCGSNVAATVSITANGVTNISKVQYYWAGIYRTQVATAPYATNLFLGAAPANYLRARLFYNNGWTVDSAPPNVVAVTNMNLTPWALTAIGQQHFYPTAGKVIGSTISIQGDSFNTISRQITGDCTFIARLTDLTSSGALPDGSTPGGADKAGIILRGSLNPESGDPLGGSSSTRYWAVFGEVNSGFYYEDNTMLGGNSAPNRTSGNLGNGNNWLKLQRVGDTCTTSVSPDGVNWTVVNTQSISGIGTTLYAAVFNYTSWNLLPYVPYASFDNVSLTGNVVGVPSVTVSPASAYASVGQSATFTAGVVGQPPFNYQWQFNGTNLFAATNFSLTLTNVQLTNNGAYTVVLTTGNGTNLSNPGILTVVAPLTWDANTSSTGAQDGNGNWGGAQTNWWNTAANVAWADNNTAIFGAGGSGNYTVTITNDVMPLSLAFNNPSGSYTLAGSGTIWSQGTPLPVVCNGNATISGVVNGNGGVSKSGSGTLTFSGNNSYSSSGPIYINGGTLVLNTPSFLGYGGGGIFINNGSTFRITQTGGSQRYDFSGTTFTFGASGGGTLDDSSGVNFVWWGSGNFTTLGGAQDVMIGSSGLNNNGGCTFNFNLTRGTSAGSDLKVASYIWNGGAVTLNGNGILELAATNTYSGTTTVNGGTLWVNGITVGGAVTVTNATLGGTGIIGGATTINPSATLSPGTTNIGTLTIKNTLTLAGNALMSINKTAATADKVQGVSTLTYGGTLTLTNLSGILTNGDTFTLFAATNYSGSFASAVLPTLATNLAWDLSNLSVNGSLTVAAFTGVNPRVTWPANLTATAVATNQIAVSWSAASDATSYVLSRDGVAIATLTGTSWKDNGLNPLTTYCYAVAAINTGGSSGNSPSACVTTPITGATFAWDANAVSANAQDGSGNWGSAPANWLYTTNNVMWMDNNFASFGVSTTTNCTVTLTNLVTPAGLIFNATGGGTYTIAGSTNLNLASAVTVTTSNNATISAGIQGGGLLVKAGNGTLAFSSRKTYSGGTTINVGVLDLTGGGGSSGTIRGTVTVNAGGTLRLSTGDATGYNADSTVINPLNLVGGTLNVNTSANQTLGNATINLTGGAITGVSNGNLDFFQGGSTLVTWPASTTATISGVPLSPLRQGSTTFTVADGSTPSGIDLDIQSVIRTSPAGDGGSSTLFKAGAGTLQLSATNTCVRPIVVSAGTLLVKGRAAFTTLTVQSNAMLGGSGVILGAAIVQGNATLAPGFSGISKLTFGSTLSLDPASATSLQLSKTGAVLTNDLVTVTNALTVGGTLTVRNIGSGMLTAGDSFKLFQVGTFAGGFNAYILPDLPAGLVWDTSQLAVNGTLAVSNLIFTLAYSTSANGNISGASNQTVNYGASGSAVSAVPNAGFAFTNWSDGLTANPRTDANVTSNIAATANFIIAAPPVVTNLNLAANGKSFTLAGQGAAYQKYILLATTNLPAVWLPVLTNPADANGIFTFTDLQVTNFNRRFYRVQMQ